MEAHPIQRRVQDLFVACLKAHDFVGRFANKSIRIASLHGSFQKEDVVHGVVPRGGCTICLRIRFRVCVSHLITTPHSPLRSPPLHSTTRVPSPHPSPHTSF